MYGIVVVHRHTTHAHNRMLQLTGLGTYLKGICSTREWFDHAVEPRVPRGWANEYRAVFARSEGGVVLDGEPTLYRQCHAVRMKN